MRLVEPRPFQLGSAHFLINAVWQSGGSSTNVGFLSSLFAASGIEPAFQAGATGSGSGQLAITVQTGRNGIGWPGPPLPSSPAARFPGARLAIRRTRTGAVHGADALYVYLPPSPVSPGDVLTFFVAEDGSTYTSDDLQTSSLARSAEGQVFPPRATDPSTDPALTFRNLNRRPGAMVLTDPQRFGNDAVLVEAALLTGPSTFQTLGGIATSDQGPAVDPDLQIPDPWPAYTFAPSKNAVSGNIAEPGLLAIVLRPLSGNFIPPVELVVTNRSGQSLLAYLPEVPDAPGRGVRVLVADDGSTYFAPTDATAQQSILQQRSLNGLPLARAAQGQALAIPSQWPLQQRVPVAINLCRSERASLLAVGELGIDPELGRFALPPQDPALAVSQQGLALNRNNLSVDFVEAFPDMVGAWNSTQRKIDDTAATRFVSRSGDVASSTADALAGAPVHSSVADAVAAARDGDVIEIADSSTYEAPAGITVPGSIQELTIRAAAGQRPCLTTYSSEGVPSTGGFVVNSPMSLLSLSGILFSGGPFAIGSAIAKLEFTACTLDPSNPSIPAIVTIDSDLNSDAEYIFSRCICGGLWLGEGVGQVTIADSIVDQHAGVAIAGAPGSASPPAAPASSARAVQLERVTVFGSILCDVLNASETLLTDVVTVNDQQSGCIRFSHFEVGSILPRRYRCISAPTQASASGAAGNGSAPLFNSRRFGRPDYAQLAAACPDAILTAAENHGEIGVFASTQNTIRLRNLSIKLQEFMPVGLSPVIVAEN
jgi:hypothetical protein